MTATSKSAENLLATPKAPIPPKDIPRVSEPIEFDPHESNFTLLTDEQTLREIDEIREDAIKAAQAILKFAWR